MAPIAGGSSVLSNSADEMETLPGQNQRNPPVNAMLMFCLISL